MNDTAKTVTSEGSASQIGRGMSPPLRSYMKIMKELKHMKSDFALPSL